ncbi:MAG: RNA polymerase sigma factor [Gemmatimonadota bacterium]|nr:RNA polymerase sigma factor [Gemmatimonadota bacterium]
MSDRRNAFLHMVRENTARLRRICRAYAEDREDEQDLFQEILFQAWRSLPSFEGEARPGTWLYRVALNTALGRKRKRDVRSRAHLSEDDPVMGSRPPRPDRELSQKRRVERLYAAIDRLSEMDRALVLMYLDEHSYAEMGDVLGLSESHVGVKLHRIRKKLSEWLEDES